MCVAQRILCRLEITRVVCASCFHMKVSDADGKYVVEVTEKMTKRRGTKTGEDWREIDRFSVWKHMMLDHDDTNFKCFD